MLRYLYADQLDEFPQLRDTMFRDRADQFKTRLNWDVSVDENGFERDEYDDLNPLYVIWETPQGTHSGSMRLLPTSGRCMVNEHFSELMNGDLINSGMHTILFGTSCHALDGECPDARWRRGNGRVWGETMRGGVRSTYDPNLPHDWRTAQDFGADG